MAVFALSLSTESYAQELTNCFVGSMPCVDVRTLKNLIRECAPNPSLCGIEPDRHAATPAQAATSSPFTPRIVTPHPDTTRPASARNESHRPVVIQTKVLASAQQRVEPGISDEERIGTSTRAIIELADHLPLDPATRDLADAMPDDPTLVERELGLRPSDVEGADMRGRTPSIADFVRALSPEGTPR